MKAEPCLCGDPCCRRCFRSHDRSTCAECGPATLAAMPSLLAADEACRCGLSYCRRCYPGVGPTTAIATVAQLAGELARMRRALDEGDYEVARSAERDIYRHAVRAVLAGAKGEAKDAIGRIVTDAEALVSRS